MADADSQTDFISKANKSSSTSVWNDHTKHLDMKK